MACASIDTSPLQVTLSNNGSDDKTDRMEDVLPAALSVRRYDRQSAKSTFPMTSNQERHYNPVAADREYFQRRLSGERTRRRGKRNHFPRSIAASKSKPDLPFARAGARARRPRWGVSSAGYFSSSTSCPDDTRSVAIENTAFSLADSERQKEPAFRSSCKEHESFSCTVSLPKLARGEGPQRDSTKSNIPQGFEDPQRTLDASMKARSDNMSFKHRDGGVRRQTHGQGHGYLRDQVTGLARPGSKGIWLCPSTTSLREEARADLEALSRPKLWHCPSGSAVREAAREELTYLKDRFKAKKKQDPKATVLSALKAEMTEDARERWMKRRALMRADRFTVQQRRNLRKWFDSLDEDGSGEIDSSELSHPLLSTGLARSSQEVADLVRHVDKDGSGEIGFHEFLAILQPRGTIAQQASPSSITSAATTSPTVAVDPAEQKNKIVRLQEVQTLSGGDMSTVVVIERRSLLMKEILDEAAYRDGAREDLANKRYLAERDGDHRALRALRARERHLELRRAKKNLFIKAVSDATDFSKVGDRVKLVRS